MGADVQVLLEFSDGSEWALIDVDPICAAERNRSLWEFLQQLGQESAPEDLSKGSRYWIFPEPEDHPVFLACIPLKEAAELRWRASHPGIRSEFDLTSVMLSVFGVWTEDPDRYYRVVVHWL